MITLKQLRHLIAKMGEVAQNDIAWAEALLPPTDPDAFGREAIFVICNSGMKHTIALMIFERVMGALEGGRRVADAFRHPGKAAAIEVIWRERSRLLDEFLKAPDQLAFLGALPWIGGITKYHLAKNFGVDVAKPDVHLQRLADREGCTAQALCERLAKASGYRVATVDTLLWRACATGFLDSRSGWIAP